MGQQGMIDAKEAVRRAFEHFNMLYAGKNFSGLMLEEVELADGERYWLVTLGYDGPGTLASMMGGTRTREYKQLKVKADTGEFVSMNVRRI